MRFTDKMTSSDRNRENKLYKGGEFDIESVALLLKLVQGLVLTMEKAIDKQVRAGVGLRIESSRREQEARGSPNLQLFSPRQRNSACEKTKKSNT